MICVPVGVATEPVGPLPLICTLGDLALAKKPDGYVSVMLLPAASAPPTVVVNENVASVEVLLATRSANATPNMTEVTAPPITPDATVAEAVWSTLVATETPPPAVGVPPMVKPITVTVTAVLAATAAPLVTTIWVLVGVATALLLSPLIVAAGDPVPEKKPDGYVSVMLLPAASLPPAVVVNEKVAAAELLPATRSDVAIANEGPVT